MNKFYIGILIILAIALTISVRSCMNKDKSIQDISFNLNHLQDSTTHWVNRYNQSVAENNNLQGTLAEFKITNKSLLDSIHKQFNTSTKNLQGVKKVKLTSNTTITTVIDTSHRGDTTSSFVHTAPHTSVKEYTIGDSAHITIQDTVNITIVDTWKRKWLLGTKEYKVQAVTDRQDVTIANLNSLTIHEKPKVIGKVAYIGLGILAGFLVFHK